MSDECIAVIVSGGRDFDAPSFVMRALDAFDARYPIGVLFEGECRGVDKAARVWAECRRREVHAMPADWASHGASAGPRRNREMLKRLLSYPRRAVVAFPGGKGTADMIAQAQKAGVTVFQMTFAWSTNRAPAGHEPASAPAEGRP